MNYNMHPDLLILSKFKVKKYTKFKMGLMNAFFRISLFFGKKDKELIQKKFRIKGYKDKKLTIISYLPKDDKQKTRALIYYHGGGFFLDGTAAHLRIIRKIAKETHQKVFFVKYHLVPKYPFPHALYDCYNSLVWVHENKDQLNIDPLAISVMGDSAGGNLAAAVSLMARDFNGPKVFRQLLLYPVLDINQKTKSMIEFTDAPVWNSKLNADMWKLYLKNGDFGMLQYASPSLASLENLPETYIETAEYDCLRDEAKEYEKRLKKAGVSVTSFHTKGSFHGYDALFFSKFTTEMMEKRFAFLKKK
jgi:acetyl esterase